MELGNDDDCAATFTGLVRVEQTGLAMGDGSDAGTVAGGYVCHAIYVVTII